MRKSLSSAPEIITQESDVESSDLEAFYKLLSLENELLELRKIVNNTKKVRKDVDCATKELQEFHASRKK
jgi:hypothetical protein